MGVRTEIIKYHLNKGLGMVLDLPIAGGYSMWEAAESSGVQNQALTQIVINQAVVGGAPTKATDNLKR